MAKQKGKRIAPMLARPGDPLVSADGRIVRPSKARVSKDAGNGSDETPRLSADNFKPSQKRSLSDLPATANIITGCAVIFVYSALGIGDREIATATDLTVEKVQQIRQHPAYTECFDMVIAEFINANSALLAARIAAHSHMAFETVANIAQHGRMETNQLRASTEILSMGGVGGSRKGGVAGAAGNEGNELRIVILEGDERSVRVELNGKAFEGGGNGNDELEVIEHG